MNHNLRHAERGGIISTLIGLLFLAVLCGAVYLARRPILRFAGESWIVDESLERADAIIVLSDDNFYADRVTRAAELMRDGKAPVVVASGRRLRPYAGIAELMQHDLIERGVAKENIVVFAHDADSTRDEAEALAKFVAEKKWTTVMLVTSNYHTRRARYVFRKIFPARVRLAVVSARDGDFDPQQWWQKRKSLKYFAREFFGMFVAVWELREHGNAPPHDENETKSPSQSVVGVAVLKLLLAV
jgi:uncharacterized SAM-binding protein YcdF (DUF218 family)